MSKWLCDTCKHAQSKPMSTYVDSEGIERTIVREHVICGELGKLWVREKVPKGEKCFGYEKGADAR